MTAGTWALTNGARTALLNGTFASGGSFKMALFTSGSNLSVASTTFAGCTSEVGTTNTGYTAGGIAVTPVLTGTTSVTWSLSANPQWTAGSATLVAKWAAVYLVSGNVLALVTLDSGGADVTTAAGQTFTVTCDTSHPVFTFA